MVYGESRVMESSLKRAFLIVFGVNTDRQTISMYTKRGYNMSNSQAMNDTLPACCPKNFMKRAKETESSEPKPQKCESFPFHLRSMANLLYVA